MRSGPVAAIIALPFLITACDKEKSAAQQAADDAKAIAMVEAAQTSLPPPVSLELQPITTSDIEKNGLYGAGCSLVPGAQAGGDPVIMANDRRATIKFSGRLITFAADAGSEILAVGVRAHYVGKTQSLWLEKATGSGEGLGQDALRWQGRATIRDAREQLVYTMAGELVCTS